MTVQQQFRILRKMPTLGRILREEREKQGLSLDYLVKRTRISRKSLEGLENDDPDTAGSAFYFRSFAKQVATLLNLNTPEWREALSTVGGIETAQPASSTREHYIPRIAPLRQRRESRWRTVSPVASFVVVLVACSGLYAILNRLDLSEGLPFQQPAHAVTDSSLSALPARPLSRRPDMNGEAILLKIAAVEKTWLSVDTDGKRIYSGLLDPADIKELEGRTSARIKTGNAGGLTVTFNGKDLGLLGQRGQVRTVVFTRDRYRIVAPNLSSRLELFPAMALPKVSL